MKKLIGLSFVLSGAVILPAATQARERCKKDAATCFFKKMPLYDQTSKELSDWFPNKDPEMSSLCGPTAGAMLLQAVIGEAWMLKRGSWSWNSFRKKSSKEQIGAQRALMNDDPQNPIDSNGTFLWYKDNTRGFAEGVHGRAQDFLLSGGATTEDGASYSNERYIEYVRQDKSAVGLMYGHYVPKIETIFGVTLIRYTRNGGHFVALNGYSNGHLHIYNPWKAMREWRAVHVMGIGCAPDENNDDICISPMGITGQRSYLLNAGAKLERTATVSFIDGHSRLWAE